MMETDEEIKKIKVLAYEKGFDDCRMNYEQREQKRVEKLENFIDTIFDHYTPYRPITDSTEMKEVRKVLLQIIDKKNKIWGLK